MTLFVIGGHPEERSYLVRGVSPVWWNAAVCCTCWEVRHFPSCPLSPSWCRTAASSPMILPLTAGVTRHPVYLSHNIASLLSPSMPMKRLGLILTLKKQSQSLNALQDLFWMRNVDNWVYFFINLVRFFFFFCLKNALDNFYIG
ncbi:hypothetical protein LAZ67_1005289 [Cordylochernes scorpioides]|uniref:Uncharacterized protein n=1 Tax=Cordylochernes scorpioides TaxID=51811 RepID=A0ABY6JY40_9ARAC|nr:hypothetical protein LAZ67_1005289 [Cordylochernes scorpioides]